MPQALRAYEDVALGDEASREVLVHHPDGYGLGNGYDFIGYFEFAEADAPIFRTVMSGLRDREQNPEWSYVREGPEWWGRRVATVSELWG